MSHESVAKLVRLNKEKYPQYYCKDLNCLYRTETALGHRECPKHGVAPLQSTEYKQMP